MGSVKPPVSQGLVGLLASSSASPLHMKSSLRAAWRQRKALPPPPLVRFSCVLGLLMMMLLIISKIRRAIGRRRVRSSEYPLVLHWSYVPVFLIT